MGICGKRHQPRALRRGYQLSMKRCQYCGSLQDDAVQICTSCGGNAFSNQCGNCGHVYNEGAFCPICGVRAGQKPKVCPRCGKSYYSNACPDCGYVVGSTQTVNVRTEYVPILPAQKKKKRIGLWVMGWILMFPVPLTILMVRNKKLPLWARILIIAVAWLFYLALGLSDTEPAATAMLTQMIV